jgi:hypothetical protein
MTVRELIEQLQLIPEDLQDELMVVADIAEFEETPAHFTAAGYWDVYKKRKYQDSNGDDVWGETILLTSDYLR